MRDKSYRRSQVKRLITNRKNDWYAGDNRKQLKIHVTTPAMCSCWMCGNPRRKHNQLTIKEKKANIDYVEYLNYINARNPLSSRIQRISNYY